jgi:hypothetical protein
MLLIVAIPLLHFINHARRGHPLDINYFWPELSPLPLFGQSLYNDNCEKVLKNWAIEVESIN